MAGRLCYLFDGACGLKNEDFDITNAGEVCVCTHKHNYDYNNNAVALCK